MKRVSTRTMLAAGVAVAAIVAMAFYMTQQPTAQTTSFGGAALLGIAGGGPDVDGDTTGGGGRSDGPGTTGGGGRSDGPSDGGGGRSDDGTNGGGGRSDDGGSNGGGRSNEGGSDSGG
jgi:hypothetical protein